VRTLLILQLDVFNQIKVSWLSWPSYTRNYTHLCITFLWNHFLQTSLRALLFCCNMKFNGVLSCVGKILLYPVCFYNPWHSCFFFYPTYCIHSLYWKHPPSHDRSCSIFYCFVVYFKSHLVMVTSRNPPKLLLRSFHQ
jgi:hypothetical protein